MKKLLSIRELLSYALSAYKNYFFVFATFGLIATANTLISQRCAERVKQDRAQALLLEQAVHIQQFGQESATQADNKLQLASAITVVKQDWHLLLLIFLSWILSVFITITAIRTGLAAVDEEPLNVSTVIALGRKAFRRVFAYFGASIIIGLLFILSLIPTGILGFGGTSLLAPYLPSLAINLLQVAIIALGLLASAWYFMGYIFTTLIIFDSPTLSIQEAFSESKELVEDRNTSLLVTIFGFVGCIGLFFGIGAALVIRLAPQHLTLVITVMSSFITIIGYTIHAKLFRSYQATR